MASLHVHPSAAIPLPDVVVAARRERLVAVCGNPRMIFQWVPRKELETSLLPLWMQCAALHRDRGRAQSSYLETVPSTVEDAIPLVDAARLIVSHITASVDSTDSARDDIAERDVVRKIVLHERSRNYSDTAMPSTALHGIPSYGALLEDMIVDLLTAVDVMQCKWITWASFTAYLIDTDNREARWTTSKHHLVKWQTRNDVETLGGYSPHGLSDVEREMASVALAKREKEGAAEDERRKEVVLLWDEDVHDTAAQLSPVRQKRSEDRAERGSSVAALKPLPVDALGEDELLVTLRRRNQMKCASTKDAATSIYGETKRSFAPKDTQQQQQCDGEDETDGGDSLAAQQFPEKAAPMMTPFELGISVAGTTDVAVRLVEIGDTPFLACFTRSGKLYVVHRSTRRKELSVPTIVFESTPIAVAFSRRHLFHKGVPGLGSFQSFLAVSTASFRLHIICCRLFEVRVVHEVKESINALAYCSERNILYGGSNSGYICVWAVSDKGFVSMIAKWRIHKAFVPITALSIASSGLRCGGSEDLQEEHPSRETEDEASTSHDKRLHAALFPDSNDMLLVGYADGSVVQVNVCSLFQMRDVVMASFAWKSSSSPGAIDIEETIPSTTSVVDMSAAANKRAISDDRNILWFSIAENAQGGASTSQAQSSSKLADGPIPSLTIHSIHFSVPLQQIVAINDEGTFALFPRDFPLAPAQRFVDTTRKSDERVVFAALDIDGTSIMIGDLSSNFYIVSLISLIVTWKQLVHAAIVDGLAIRGRAPVTHSKGLDSDTPVGYCGVVLRGGSSTGVDTVLYNTGDGCVVMVIDSVVAPSSGSLFTREPDDLLCCEPHPLNSDLVVVANPFQVCLYDVAASRRFAMHSLASAEMLMHTAARRNVQRNHELRITAVAVSLSGHRVYIGGSNGSLSVARLDTGRAVRRFSMPPNCGDVLSLHCGGVGNLPRDDFLCITASMTLLVCNDSPKLYAEHEASPIQRMFRLGLAAPSAGLQAPAAQDNLPDTKQPKGLAVASALPLMPSLMYRLPGNMNSYLFVTATSRVSLAQWDVKNFEWQHIWVSEICPTAQVQLNLKQRLERFGTPSAVESVTQRRKKGKGKKRLDDEEEKKEYVEDVSESFAVRGPRRQLQLSAGDSVFCVQPLLPYPLLCIGSLHGELLLIVTKPHVQYGECVARWKQRAAYTTCSDSVEHDMSSFVRSAPAPQDAAPQSSNNTPNSNSSSLLTSSAAEPSVNSIGFFPPYTLVVCDTTGRSNIWDVSDVIIQLRMANVFDQSKTSLSGSAQRQLVHEVHRPAIIRFVASQASYDHVVESPSQPALSHKPKAGGDDRSVVISKFHFHFPFVFVAVDSKSRVLFLRLGGAAGANYIEQRPSFAEAIAQGRNTQGRASGAGSAARKRMRRAVMMLNILWRLITKYRPSPPPTPNNSNGGGTSEQQQQPLGALSNSFVSPLHPKLSFRSSSALLRKLSSIRTDISGERKSIPRSSTQEKSNARPTAFTCSLALVVGAGGADGEVNHRCVALRDALVVSRLFDYYGYPLREGKYLAWRSKLQSKDKEGITAKERQAVDAFIDSSSDDEDEVVDSNGPTEFLRTVPTTIMSSVQLHSSSSSTPATATGGAVREISSHLLTVGGSELKTKGEPCRAPAQTEASASDGSFVTFQPTAKDITISCIPHDASERKRVERRRSDTGPNLGVNAAVGSEDSLQCDGSTALVCMSRVSLKSPFGGTPTLNQNVAKELRDGPVKQFASLSCGGATVEDLSQDVDMIRASKCFSFDPATDPGYHTRKRQMEYVCMEKTKRSLLAASYAPRILKRDERYDPPQVSTLDTRKLWAPFSSLRDEVEAVIKSAKLNVPEDPAKPLFSTKRELSATEKPSVLKDRPRPTSAALPRCDRSRTPKGTTWGSTRPGSADFPSTPERSRFGFVKLLRRRTSAPTEGDTVWLVDDDATDGAPF